MKWARIAAFAAMAITAGVSSAQPASFSVVTKTTALGHEDVSVDVYRPQQFDSIGVAVLAHGFTRDRLRDRDLARALASAGIIAVAPDLPSAVNLIGNGDAVAGLVADLERGTLGIAPTPRARIVLIGTSAGGLATVIAASQLPGLAGWIGLDPVDGTGMGTLAARKLQMPTVVLLADPSVCNLFGSGRLIANALPSASRAERMRGASHCDFEGPTNKFCRTVCGKGDPGRADAVRHAAVNAALDMLDTASAEPFDVRPPDSENDRSFPPTPLPLAQP
jgi:pimeloyl-ACP methyl ester carboxylesterase